MGNIYKSVDWAVGIALDNTHGYDQTNRNGPDYDCSSLIGTALHQGGYNVSPRSWTGNLEQQLRQNGFKECHKPWKAGDIHLRVGSHVCMSIDADKIVEASINEKGKITGGKTGDQTGKEIWIHDYYDYSGGWDFHFRAPEAVTVPITDIAKEVIAGKWGNGQDRKNKLTAAGYDYYEVQKEVNRLLKSGYEKPIDVIAQEVIDGRWGNGLARKARLKAAGYNYDEVQKRVNEILSGKK